MRSAWSARDRALMFMHDGLCVILCWGFDLHACANATTDSLRHIIKSPRENHETNQAANLFEYNCI